MNKTLDISEQRFQPTGLNSHFHFENFSFANYVTAMREIIEKSRLDLTEQNAEEIIDANSPFEWTPSDKNGLNPSTGKIQNGILLIHGLFDSPYTLWSLAQHFIGKNFLVRSLLLPGHGTIPGDLVGVTYDEWVKATEYGANSFINEVENLFLCGFSTGSSLALHEAYANISNLKGLILFAPAIKLKTQFAIMSSINHLLTQTIGGIKWYIKTDEKDYAKYHSFTLNSAHQVHLLTRKNALLHKQKSLTVPIYGIATADDEVISTSATVTFFKSLANPLNRLRIYTNNPINYSDPRIIQIESAYPDKNIINFSHMCLAVAPDHSHYGANSTYQDFNHYEIFKKYVSVQNRETKAGAITRENLKKYQTMRLTYNPDFANMMQDIDNFISNCSSGVAGLC